MAEPLAFGLYNVRTGKLLLPNVYARHESARAAAARRSSRWATYVAAPLFGPDALITAPIDAQGSTPAAPAAPTEED